MPANNRSGTTRMNLAEAKSVAAAMRPLPVISDEEVERRAKEDTDAPLASDEQLAHATREYQAGSIRGRPKILLSLRVDPDVIDAYRSTGKGWQARMHDAIVAGAPGRLATSRVGRGMVAMPQPPSYSLEERVSAIEKQLARPNGRAFKYENQSEAHTQVGHAKRTGKSARSGENVVKSRDRTGGKQKPSR